MGSASWSSITSKTASKSPRTARIASRSPAKKLALVDGRVGGADQVEDGRARLGGVQVVGQRGHVFGLRLLRGRLQAPDLRPARSSPAVSRW